MNDILKIRDEQALTSLPMLITKNSFPTTSGIDTTGKYFLATSENNNVNFCYGTLDGSIKNHLSNFHKYISKERLYITAISNLYKKVDYLQLTMQLDNELISEDEFDYELETFENRYLISSNDNFKSDEFELAVSIANNITQREFSTDELAELFSIPIERVNKLLQDYEFKCKFLNSNI
ncbi:hypothetical protein [Flavobacterium sp.]|jgi:hypothetical protein|uniref:hypothetical protein n=1 Tax=Flavobacterium sp. TaxID=239 RepID=UPI0037C09114